MNPKELCSMVDHTLLKQTATWEEIQKLCRRGYNLRHGVGVHSTLLCVCVAGAPAHEYVQGKMTICTVVGFPNGNMTPAAKEFETREGPRKRRGGD